MRFRLPLRSCSPSMGLAPITLTICALGATLNCSVRPPGTSEAAPVQVGATAAHFEVDADGAATYAVRIEAPPGIRGVEPQLELVYDSSAADGFAGPGVRLQGLSYLTRTGANVTQDGFRGAVSYDADDRFELDGVRLITVEGTPGSDGSFYRTERETFRWIIARDDPSTRQPCGAGPCVFEMTDRRGWSYGYGETPDSRIAAVGRQDVRVWALNRVRDLQGNSMEITYTQTPYAGAPAGEVYPLRIDYTSNPGSDLEANRSVRFAYAPRPDVRVSYVGGSGIPRSALLTHVTTYVRDEAVRQYQLGYEASPSTGRCRLATVQEVVPEAATAADSAGAGVPSTATEACPASVTSSAVRLRPTRLAWQDSALRFDDRGAWLENAFVFPAWLPNNLRFLVDVNGDALADIVGFNAGVQVSTSTGDGSFDAVETWNSEITDCWLNVNPCTLADVTGDGIGDLVAFETNGVIVAPSTGHRFDPSRWAQNQQGFPHYGSGGSAGTWFLDRNPRLVVDVNGDGLADIVGFHQKTFVSTSQGNGFAVPRVWNDSDFTGGTWDTGNNPRLLGDVNGDGQADVVGFGNDGVLVGLSTGDAANSFDTSKWAQNPPHGPGFPFFGSSRWFVGRNPRLLADVNGDGLLDIVGFLGGTQVALSTGEGFEAPVQWVADFSIDTFRHFPWTEDLSRVLQDVNGDGRADVVGFGLPPFGATVALSTDVGCPAGHNSCFLETAWDQGSLTSFAGGNSNNPILVGDVNGDGLADAVNFGGVEASSVSVATAGGPYPDLATTLTDGLGKKLSLEYAPLTDPEVYTRGALDDADPVGFFNPSNPTLYTTLAGVYPKMDLVNGRLYVVAAVEETNDPALQSHGYRYGSSYRYAAGLLDIAAKRSLGFRSLTRVNQQTQLQRITTFRQDYPFDRRVDHRLSSCLEGSPDTLCAEQDQTGELAFDYESQQTATGTGPQAPPVFLVLRTARRRDYFTYGTYDFSIGETYEYRDGFGNLTLESYLGFVDRQGHNLSPEDDVYTISSYRNEVGSTGWKLGYLSARKRSRVSDANLTTFDTSTDLTFETLGYDNADTLNVTRRSRWDDQNDLFLVTQFGYDPFGNRSSVTDPAGFTTTTTYDAVYRTYPDVRTLPLQVEGQPLTVAFGFDPADGRRVARAGPNGLRRGQPLGDTTIRVYDAFGRLSKRQGPPPDIPGIVTDPNAVTARVTGATPWSTAPVVTLEDETWGADGASASDLFRRTATLQDWPTGPNRVTRWHKAYVDGRDRTYLGLTEGNAATGNEVRGLEHDWADRTISRSVPGFTAGDSAATADVPLLGTRTSYDVYGRTVRQTQPRGRDGAEIATTALSYPDRKTRRITRAAGEPYAYEQMQSDTFRDGHRRVHQTVVPGDGNATTSFGYDRLGRLTSAVDPATAANPEGVANSVTYDSLSRRTSVASQDFSNRDEAGQVLYHYDDKGRLHTETSPIGTTRFEDYDALGRVETVRHPAGLCAVPGAAVAVPARTTYTYDDPKAANGLGRLTGVTIAYSSGASQSQQRFGYDPYGRRSSEVSTVEGRQDPFTLRWRHDPLGRVVQLTYPGDTASVLVSDYANGNLVSQAVDGETRVRLPAAGYNPFGAPGRIEYANGVTTTFGFSPAGLPYDHRIAAPDTAAWFDVAYDWNLLDQRRSQTPQGEGSAASEIHWVYTSLRLTSASGPIAPRSYGYSADGNTKTIDGATYRYRAHQVLGGESAAGETVYQATYYRNGAVETRTLDGDLSTPLTHCYDGAGRLSSVYRSGGLVSSYVYDHQGQRITRTGADGTLTFYVDRSYELEASPDGAETATRYVPGHLGPAVALSSSTADASAGFEALYLHHDLIRSTILTSGESGEVLDRIDYNPYGRFEVTAGTGDVRPKYSSREYEPATGLYYFGARYLDPQVGQFVTPDSGLASHLTRQDTLNRYAYVVADPIGFVDPTGAFIAPAVSNFIRATRITAEGQRIAQVVVEGQRAVNAAAQATNRLIGLVQRFQESIRASNHPGWVIRRRIDRLQGDELNAAVEQINDLGEALGDAAHNLHVAPLPLDRDAMEEAEMVHRDITELLRAVGRGFSMSRDRLTAVLRRVHGEPRDLDTRGRVEAEDIANDLTDLGDDFLMLVDAL